MIREEALLAALLLIPAAGEAAAETPDVKALIEASEPAQEADNAAWARSAFRRHVTRQRLDAAGEVEWRQEMHFQVTPTAEGIDELLLEIDGREPKAKEVKSHRKAGRHVKHFTKVTSGELKNPFGEDLALKPLIFDQELRYEGEEEVDGTRCHRLAFDARPGDESLSTSEQLKRAARGTACLSVQGLHLVEAEVETVREVKQRPLELRHMKMRVEYRPAGDAWVPRLVEMRSEVKAPGKHLRTWNLYRYSDYRLPGGE